MSELPRFDPSRPSLRVHDAVSAEAHAAAHGVSPRSRTVLVAICIALMIAAQVGGIIWLDEAALVALLGVLLLPGLRRARVAIWLGIALLFAWLGARGEGRLALDAIPVLVNAALGLLFARTLAGGREPLIACVIAAIEGRERLARPRIAAYARRLTWIWTILFLAQALLLAALVLCRVPEGVLATLGMTPPFAFAGTFWRDYLVFGNYVLVPLLLVGEYAFRRWHLRDEPHPSLPRFVASLVRHWPAIVRNITADVAPRA